MLYYQFALPRVVFVTAPLAYLLFNLNIIYSSASLIVSYALPHLFLAIYVGSRMNGRYRYSFWGEIYDIVLAFHLVLPTLVTMISPNAASLTLPIRGGCWTSATSISPWCARTWWWPACWPWG